ncbi:uncharacterized protein LOC114773015 [Denticeps clupeoides]|uniref:DUF4585 domain-containing protein n=1 Tax=Denticeps clupeoides TaxID=299321 RepID=A0AAY4D7Q6_9TELE|nr:uncharacterized protein LOC114773015 [Denticeps clupeoides]
MNCLDKRIMTHRMTMQHHRYMDNLCESFMDETDREVSSLTDRAFRSLCIGDEAVYNDSEFSPPPISCLRPLAEELSKRTSENCIKQTNGANETPLRQQKNLATVSSLFAAFSAATEKNGDNTIRNHQLRVGNSVDTWDKSALLSIQKELAEFSTDYHKHISSGQFSKMKNHLNSSEKHDGKKSLNDGKTSKPKHGKSSKLRKLNSKNFFLHSEFSPFQSWRDLNRFPFCQEEISDLLPSDSLPKWYDSPLYKELTAAHRVNPAQQQEALQRIEGSHRIKTPQERKTEHCQKQEAPQATALQTSFTLEKRCQSDSGETCAPWRKNRGRARSVVPTSHPEKGRPPNEKPNYAENLPKKQEVKSTGEQSSKSSTPFSISQLLTPVIPSHQETETSEVLQAILSGALDFSCPSKSSPETKPRDGYKAMASSLLFNLKDNRKRVKAMYSPSTFKSADIADQTKASSMPESSLSKEAQEACPKAGDIHSSSNSTSPKMSVSGHTKQTDSVVDMAIKAKQNVKERVDNLQNSESQVYPVGMDLPCLNENNGYGGLSSITNNKSVAVNKYPCLNLYKKAGSLDTDTGNCTPSFDTAAQPVRDMNYGTEQTNTRQLKEKDTCNKSMNDKVMVVQSTDPAVGPILNANAESCNKAQRKTQSESSGRDENSKEKQVIAVQIDQNTTHSEVALTNLKDLGINKLEIVEPTEACRDKARPKHIFAARQNNYIKSQRHAIADNEKDEAEETNVRSEDVTDSVCLQSQTHQEFRLTESTKVMGDCHSGGCTSDEPMLGKVDVSQLRGRGSVKNKPVVNNLEEEVLATPRGQKSTRNEILAMKGNTLAKRDIFANKEPPPIKQTLVPKKEDATFNKYDLAKAALEEIILERQERRKKLVHLPCEEPDNATEERHEFKSSGQTMHSEHGVGKQGHGCGIKLAKEDQSQHLTRLIKHAEGDNGFKENKSCNISNNSALEDSNWLHRTAKSVNECIEEHKGLSMEGDLKQIKKDTVVVRQVTESLTAADVPPRKGKSKCCEEECQTGMGDFTDKAGKCVRDRDLSGSDINEGLESVDEKNGQLACEIPIYNEEGNKWGDFEYSRKGDYQKFIPGKTNQPVCKMLVANTKMSTNINAESKDSSECKRSTQSETTKNISFKSSETIDSQGCQTMDFSKNETQDESNAVKEHKTDTGTEKEIKVKSSKNYVKDLLNRLGLSSVSPIGTAHLDQDRIIEDAKISSPFGQKSPVPTNAVSQVHSPQVPIMSPCLSLENLLKAPDPQSLDDILVTVATKAEGNCAAKENLHMDKSEIVSCSLSNPETDSEISDRSVLSPLSDMDKGGWVRCLIEHAQNLTPNSMTPNQSNASSPALGKPVMFKVKDNTFSSSPVVKSVRPILHKTIPNTNKLWSPKGSISGSEKGEEDVEHLKEPVGVQGGIAKSPVKHLQPADIAVFHVPTPTTQPNGSKEKQSLSGRLTVPEEEERHSVASVLSDGLESSGTSAGNTVDEIVPAAPLVDAEGSKAPSEQPGSIYSANDSQFQNKPPPAVLPKTEKALRRAMKLNNRRIQKEVAKSKPEGKNRSNEKLEGDMTGRVPPSTKKHANERPDHKGHTSDRRSDIEQSHSSNQGERRGRSSEKQLHAKHDNKSQRERRSRSHAKDTHAQEYQSHSLEGDGSIQRSRRSKSCEKHVSYQLDTADEWQKCNGLTNESNSHSDANPSNKAMVESTQLPTQRSNLNRIPGRQNSLEHTYAPAFPMTQRKLLQDVDSGQYFVVDMPIQIKTKTFFDPETRSYIQLPVQPPEGAVPAAPSMEVLSTPLVYHGFVPVPVSSLPLHKSATALAGDVDKKNSAPQWMEDEYQQNFREEDSYDQYGPDDHTPEEELDIVR